MGIMTICPHCDLRFDTGLEDCWGLDMAQCPACNRRFAIGNGLTRSLTYNVSIPPMRCPIHQYRPELIVKDVAGKELRLDDYEVGHEDGESLDGYLDRVGVDFCVWCPYCTVGEPMYASSKESLEDAYEKWNDKVNGERNMDEMKTEMISLFVWDGMTLEEMCDCDRLLEAYGVRIDWDSMEDVVDGYTVDAEWEHTPEFGRGRLMSTIQCEFDGAIRLRWDDE